MHACRYCTVHKPSLALERASIVIKILGTLQTCDKTNASQTLQVLQARRGLRMAVQRYAKSPHDPNPFFPGEAMREVEGVCGKDLTPLKRT